jgi:ubiquitin C-terminal hydrolase
MVNHITCLTCGFSREREEPFFDLMVQVNKIKRKILFSKFLLLKVKNFTCLEESLFSFITPERLDGSNQYFCENCDAKSDADKGLKLRKFPNILTFSLSRFEFDFEKMDRVKVISNILKRKPF